MTPNEEKLVKKGYLLLRRKEGQGVTIDKDTEVLVSKIEGDKVYLSIKAVGKRIVRNEILGNEPRSPTSIAT